MIEPDPSQLVIKIISDGTVSGTSIVDAVTGKPTAQVSRVTWEASADGGWTHATLELDGVPVEIKAVVA